MGGVQLDANEARAFGSLLHDEYKNASPFPHVVVDNFLPDELVRDVLLNFHVEEVTDERTFEMGYAGQHKRQILPEACSAFNRELFQLLNSRSVLQYLEGLTGLTVFCLTPTLWAGDSMRHRMEVCWAYTLIFE